jgi:hypothetical protein
MHAEPIPKEYLNSAELDRPTPRDRDEYRKFKTLIKNFIDSRNPNRTILVATISTEIVGLVSYVLLDSLNQVQENSGIQN